MTAQVFQLNAHENMTPEEALAYSARENWSDVIIIGYQNGELTVRSSHMTRAESLWIIEHGKLHVMKRLD